MSTTTTTTTNETFHIIPHTTRTQHTRSRYAGISPLPQDQNSLKLCVKQYIPRNNPHPQEGDVTIIGAGADGYPKEIYEVLWEGLVRRWEEMEGRDGKRRKVRAIWVADPVNQGESGVGNEGVLGADPSWFDHGRDLLFLINQFQDEIPHPIVGIGHSMGASHLAHLSLLHPRLLDSLILIDPVFQLQGSSSSGGGQDWARASTFRRDHWPSRSLAETKLRSSPGLRTWDPAVLEKFLHYGLRECPTEMYPSPIPPGQDIPVTLQTTVAQEVYNYIQPTYHDPRLLIPEHLRGRDFHPEDVRQADGANFMRAEMAVLWRRLEELQPCTLFIFGRESAVSGVEARRAKTERTGRGVGGNGGMETGMVREVVLDCGHLVPLELPLETARVCAGFVDEEVERWIGEEGERRRVWEGLTRREQVGLNDLWREKMGGPPKRGEKKEKEKRATKL